MTMNDPFSRLAARAPHPSDSVLASIREELGGRPEKKRSLTRLQRVALSALALATGVLLTSLTAVEKSPQVVLLAAAALSLSVGGLLLAGAVPGEARSMGRSWRMSLVGVLCVFAFTFLALRAESFSPFSEFLGGESLRRASACAGHSLVSGVVGCTALLFLWRRTDPFSPGLTGSLLALLGGAVGTTSVGLICENTEGLHLTVAHGVGLVVFAVVGLFVGKKWLSP